MMILKSQIKRVRLTLAKEREMGETYLDRNAPIGTEIAIEQMKPTDRKISIFDLPKSMKYLL
jgi:hypothetical protein